MDIERISNQVTGTATAGSGAYTVFSGFSWNEIGVIAGIVLTIIFGCLNLALTWYFKKKHYDLEREKVDNERKKLEQKYQELFGKAE